MFSTLDIICEIHTFKISLLKDHGVSLKLQHVYIKNLIAAI